MTDDPKLTELINRVIHTQETIADALKMISVILEKTAAMPAPASAAPQPNDGRPRAPFGKSKGMTVDQLDDQGMNYWHNVWKCEGWNGKPPRPEEVAWKKAVAEEYVRRKGGATQAPPIMDQPGAAKEDKPVDEDVPF